MLAPVPVRRGRCVVKYSIRVLECARLHSAGGNTAQHGVPRHAATHSGGSGRRCRAREQQAQTASQAYRQGKVAIAKMEGSLNSEFDTTNDKVRGAQAVSVLLHFRRPAPPDPSQVDQRSSDAGGRGGMKPLLLVVTLSCS